MKKGVSAVIATVLMLIITIALAGTAYMYITGVFTGTVQEIEIVDSFCEGGEVTITIRNIGTTAITSLNIKQASPSDDILTASFQGAIEPGKTINYKDTCEGVTGRSCIYRIIPPIGKAATATSYCAQKPTSLVLWQSFNEGSGTTAGDSSEYKNDGVLYDANLTNADGNTPPQWVDGKFGPALQFDGIDDYVNMSHSTSLNITAEITIEAWIKLTDITGRTDNNIILNKEGIPYEIAVHDNTNPAYACGFATDQIPTYNFAWYLGGVAGLPDHQCGWKDGGGPVQTNTWTHVALTYEGSTVKTFINGILQREYTGSGDIQTTDQSVKIGARTSNWPIGEGPAGSFFYGTIDEIRIYNKAIA